MSSECVICIRPVRVNHHAFTVQALCCGLCNSWTHRRCSSDDNLEIDRDPTDTKKNRKPHFTTSEVETIVNEVQANYEKLFGAFSASLDQAHKKSLWQSIVSKVNAVSPCLRTFAEVKHKWQDLQLKSKKKEADRQRASRQTGGGLAPPPLNGIEEKVISFIPKVLTQGIVGGIDTYSSNTCKLTESAFEAEPCQDVFVDASDVLIDLCTGKEIIIHDDYSISDNTRNAMCASGDARREIPEASICENPKEFNSISKEVSSARKSKRESSQVTETKRLIEIEEEKLALKRRKLELLEQQNQFLQIIAEKLKSES